ncbi:hypothetical protein [Streptomyces longwoodensis]|uniref:hypothetical protein n=1 Tax=Streptomyces longwoodensis TaxID=68231 RepID=UPI00384C3FED
MSDDDRPDNVLQMPRIGSPPPPPVPPPPALDEPPTAPATDPGSGHGVRISAFDAPPVPHAPPPPAAVPAALRSDGLDDDQGAADIGAPRTGALSLAAVLAIALAAFEGLQTWIQESGPRRAEAAKHQREMELSAAKATADAARLGAEADAALAKARASRIQSSHAYGRSALGRGTAGHRSGSGSLGRSSSGAGPGASRKGASRPHSGSTGLSGLRQSAPRRDSAARTGNGHTGSRSSGSGGAAGGRGSSGSSWGSGTGNRGGGSGSSGSGRGSGSGGNAGGRSGPGGSPRRSPRQAVADWFKKNKTPGGGTPSGDTRAAVRTAAKKTKAGPTFWEAAGDKPGSRWKPDTRRKDSGKDSGKDDSKTGDNAKAWTAPGDRRTTFKEAVADAFADRWKRRRDQWDATGGPRRTAPEAAARPDDASSAGPAPEGGKGRRRRAPRPGDGEAAAPPPSGGPRTDGPGPRTAGAAGPRSSPFDADPPGPAVTYTVEQAGPARSNRPPQPTTSAAAQLPRQGPPALPRAPQRPAGPRPGTTRRKDPIPMPPAPARTADVPTPATVGGVLAQHATDITLDDVLKALTLLTTEGMETHDDCANLARNGEQLLRELESMAADLAANHNVVGPRTLSALFVLMESVAQMVAQAKRMARAALSAAELSEAEETAMARDYRPTQDATADAGLVAPSARIHNEN